MPAIVWMWMFNDIAVPPIVWMGMFNESRLTQISGSFSVINPVHTECSQILYPFLYTDPFHVLNSYLYLLLWQHHRYYFQTPSCFNCLILIIDNIFCFFRRKESLLSINPHITHFPCKFPFNFLPCFYLSEVKLNHLNKCTNHNKNMIGQLCNNVAV